MEEEGKRTSGDMGALRYLTLKKGGSKERIRRSSKHQKLCGRNAHVRLLVYFVAVQCACYMRCHMQCACYIAVWRFC